LVDSDRYFLTASRYIELNPVRAGMVEHPSMYPWSSYRANGMGFDVQLITPHPVYIALGGTADARRGNYRTLFDGVIPEATINEIRENTNKSWVLGSEKFKE
jgi:putative transposase